MNPSSTNEERPGNALRIERERDLYRRLLDLGQQTRIEPFLKEALVLVAELAGAREIYLQLDDPRSEEAAWWLAHGFSDAEIEDVRRHLSSGIIAEALATGHSIDTPSALLDPRFAERGSVEREGIGAVLCVPIGTDPPLGVLYLQDRNLPGGFSSADKSEAELFARHLAPQVRRLVEAQHSASEGDPTLPMRQKLRCDGVVGRSPALAGLLKEVALVAPLDVSVLLTGESGTGKSQIARVLHDNSPRAGKPFVELNCAALPDTLIESELFGALPGAHSTATRRQLGKIAAAEGGTLFLDEVGELAAPAQSKLLQVLQSREYHPLGATRPERADIRVVAATNADLERAVADGRFREDLFYRLQVLPLRLPSLAERRGDVPLLAEHFCNEACERHGLPRLELSGESLRALEASTWPGNVRELAHALEAAVIRAHGDGADHLERRHLFAGRPAEGAPDAPRTFQSATRAFQKDLLREVLEATNWNVREAAHRLEITRSHVYNLIRAFGLDKDG